METSGDLYIDLLTKSTNHKLGFNENVNYKEWKKEIKEKFIELTGIDLIEENKCPLNFEIIETKQKDGYTQRKCMIESEKGAFVPFYVLIPNTNKEKYPVAITLQGHSSLGAIFSVNEVDDTWTEDQKSYGNGRGCFAVQAVKRGFIAVAIEQRGMGERRPHNRDRNANMCSYEGLTSLLFGRTLIGERCYDVSKCIDALANFIQVDMDKILITGNSGGGTISYYASCYDERIKLTAPSCAFCTYEKSIIFREHCVCNYIPSAFRYFEMDDLACMIAPRNLLVIAGQKDGIFLIDGVRQGMEKVKKIFEKENALNNCRLVETDKAHYWCEDIVWDSIIEETKKMGW